MQDLEDTLDSADASAGDNTDGDDFLYEEARELVVKSGKASTSYLQRKLKLGYARAARIMDILEERGVIGPADGAKSREVYIKREESFDEEDQDKGLVLDDTDEEESKEKR